MGYVDGDDDGDDAGKKQIIIWFKFGRTNEWMKYINYDQMIFSFSLLRRFDFFYYYLIF